MTAEWQRMGSRTWWIMATVFFLGLELVLRIKLGSIFMLAMGWVIVHQWLSDRLGSPAPESRQGQRILFAIFAALVICVAIFLVFAGLNIGLRSINNEWRWFQLP